MKKIIIIALTICLAFSLSITCFAATNTGFHASSVTLDKSGTLHVYGWFYNTGNVTVGHFNTVSMKVYDKYNARAADADFEDSKLSAITLSPGQGISWTFNITGVDPNTDISKWNVKTTINYTNYDSKDLGSGIKVFYNGAQVSFSVAPQAANGSTLVQMRTIFEKMGAALTWDGPTNTVIATRDETTIKLTLNSNTAYVNGKAIALSTPAIAVNGATMVPLRFISESLGCTVVWGDTDQVACIYE